jgi:signal transduction histidine kinase
MDIVQNSLKAGAVLIRIEVRVDTAINMLYITIEVNGHGMSADMVWQLPILL